ncbi:2-oxoglutarate dehydrogenase E2 component (dihydrolipoamide succinyltransferase) [Desulfosalsimonas propionicica]|uniref:Dihydrolipoyllysine-residue succinyltransferase component of 2-oxoglutarate dehydrogenase complex n=1 Tax=Desulfosalsimonas propionicica TaxID=332175 RepID=A0A7W0CAZ1_9BACT|nr:2-oxoglutarate dehydrogenase complex dihydrolipoyllysine-residue succinyltransferase [Desulfosalsimonas propionicica]MBA2882385.1 2-oxoglutarate dehydrogenase E2 component (dihydrolipoamide succinyltransferase) [Desulfosalsimonas propionicica]
MKVDIKVPEVGESVKEALLAEWYKSDGDRIEKDEPVFVIETDKVTLEVPAEQSGILEILVQAGQNVKIGQAMGKIDTDAAQTDSAQKADQEKQPSEAEEKAAESAPTPEPEPAPKAGAKQAETEPGPEAIPARSPEPQEPGDDKQAAQQAEILPPSVRRLVAENNLDVSKIRATGPNGRITKGDVIAYLESGAGQTAAQPEQKSPRPSETKEAVTRTPMSPIRKSIAAHLLDARQNTAMLTTFNEIDMSRVKTLRERFKDTFHNTHGVRLGFMSFFVKACVAALREFPEINAGIEEDEIVYHHYYHIGIAIGAKKGLVVPVVRHADRLGFADIEEAIADFATRVEKNRITLSELEGGTFSITNGGIYGSLLSTPILNMPQSAILAMHKIEDRPVVENKEVVIRPMMYVALSYDHRIVDGKDAVSFLRRIKEFIETPERMIMEI